MLDCPLVARIAIYQTLHETMSMLKSILSSYILTVYFLKNSQQSIRVP